MPPLAIARQERRQPVAQTITLRLEAEREEDLYVAHCPDLDLSSYGDTLEEAFAHLNDAVLLYLDTIEEDGERDRIFRERGIKVEDRLGTDYAVKVHPGVFTTVSHFNVGAA